MAFVHGKGTVVSLSASDMSAFSNSVEWKRSADSHDVTCFGKSAHVFKGGLLNGSGTIKGVYDGGATGPAAVIEPLLGTNVAMVYKPEGSTTGRPVKTVNVLITGYEESAPVADMIMWNCSFQMSDTVAVTVSP